MGVLSWLKERRNVATLAVISALRGAWFNLRGVIWQPFVLSLGIPMGSLGGLESLTDLTRIIVQPMVGSASDIYGRKKFLLAREVLVLAAGLLFIFAESWPLLFLGVILVGLSSALYPIWNSVVAESSEPSELGYIYSVIGTVNMALGLVATMAAGVIASTYGYRMVFVVASAIGLITILTVWMRLPETMARKSDSKLSLGRLAGSLVGSLKPPRYLWGFYIAMSVDLIAFNMGYRLLFGMLSDGYGYTPYMLGVVMTVLTAANALSQIPLGKLMDRYGYVRFMFISQILACVVIGFMLYSKSYAIVIAAQALMGVAASFWSPAEQAWIAINVDPEKRAQAIASYSTFRGLASLPAPFIGGLLFDAYGFDIPMLANLVLAFVDAILILVLVKDRVLPNPKEGRTSEDTPQ
jgi:DHA1 family tetracycline resistance protein-like MFS transporter